jgi:hypothetical protein
MQAKTFRKAGNETQTVQRVIRSPKTQDEINKELRIQRALDTRRRTVEDYLTPNTRPFGV